MQSSGGRSTGRLGRALLFGGDYCPEQWPAAMLDDDLVALEQLGVNTVTLPVFAWALLHPAKDRYELGWLDRIVEAVAARGLGVVLATPTAAQPPWMSAAYPELLPVDAAGRRRRHGGRVNYCPTSPTYREASAEIAATLAEHYADLAALRLWHVNNEYGPVCFCERCADGFRRWAAERYGDLAATNAAWGTHVWGNTLGDWAEIELPSQLNAMAPETPGRVRYAPNPSLALDHARYCSAVLLECYRNERAAIAEHTPDVPVTTNFHGPVQAVDWHEWAPHCDIVAWDSYPRAGEHWAHAAFGHDLARGAGRRGELLVMESSPGAVNWHDHCALKRPGEVRLEAQQAVARGARGVLYFQVRQSPSGAELNHAALIPRHGRLDTRMGAELVATSDDLRAIGLPHERYTPFARLAIVFDWPSWWAHHNTPGLDQRSRYLDTARAVHRALAERGETCDVVAAAGPFDGYDAVVAPLLHLAADDALGALDAYVRAGGVLVTTAGSAIVGTTGHVHAEGADPRWRALTGLWVEETDVQPAGRVNRVQFTDGTVAPAGELFDIVRVEEAEPLAEFLDDFYAGSPAVTRNRCGAGTVAYVASPTPDLVAEVVGRFAPAVLPAVRPADAGAPRVECVPWRGDEPGSAVAFALNHGDLAAMLLLDDAPWVDLLTGATHRGELSLAAGTAVVLERSARTEFTPDQGDQP